MADVSINHSQLRYCRRPPSQGGLSRSQLNEIARKLGINPKQYAKKDDLCSQILNLIHLSPSNSPSTSPTTSSPSTSPTTSSPSLPTTSFHPSSSPTTSSLSSAAASTICDSDNEKIIKQLREVAEYYESLGEIYRNKALLQAIKMIETFPEPITNPEQQLKGIKGIGKGTIDRISEYLHTGTIQELQKKNTIDQRRAIINQLTSIFGIGAATADRLIDQGITTIEILKEKVSRDEIKLTDHQKFGLEYYDDLRQRIPRNEVAQIGTYVLTLWSEINPNNLGEIVGSYRRGCETSGDIDILVSHSENENHLEVLVEQLKHSQLIERILSFGKVKFMGTYLSDTQTTQLMRKIDIRYVPPECWPTALLHSTGSDQFNVLCRKRALELNMTLSEFGLFKLDTNDRIPVTTEQDVLSILNLDSHYLNPKNRTL